MKWNNKTNIEYGYPKNMVICQFLVDQLFTSVFSIGK